MKKILTNKKGFTLIELLAVIVVLAIIMVIATQQVNKTISGSRANAFVESYQMLVKQVKTFIASDEEPTCSGADACLTKYDLSDDYTLTVEKATSGSSYTIKLTGANSGKFKNLDIGKYGNYNTKLEDGTTKCDKTKIASGATDCDSKSITGKVDY